MHGHREMVRLPRDAGVPILAGIDQVGTIEAGKRAELVLLDRDPLADITNTRGIAAVVGGMLPGRPAGRRPDAGPLTAHRNGAPFARDLHE